MRVPDVISNLLISNSRILKEKFIQLIKDENTNYESEKVKLKNSNLQFSCYTGQNLNESESNHFCLKLIDTSDKNVINSLFEMTADNADNESLYSIKSIVYIFDESNIDTFTFVETIHKELISKHKEFMNKSKIPFLLCNLANMLAIRIKKTTATINDQQQQQSTKLIENFLAENQEITYTTHSPANKIGSTNESMNLVGNNFNKLITKVKFNHYRIFNQEKSRTRSISLKSGDSSALNLRQSGMAGKERSGGMYDGEVKDNLRNGYGVYVYDNKFFRYEGDWKDGKKNGQGKIVMRDGSYVEGCFKDGEINGKGHKYNRSSGTEYTGDFVNGQLQGKGKITVNNTIYDGEFQNNKRHGYGELNEERLNRVYKGQWYLNKKHGQGEQRYSDGSVYTGDWIQDKRQGHGEARYLDSSTYEGQWRNDMFNGHGTYVHGNGYKYEGVFENNKPYKLATNLTVAVNVSEIEESVTCFNMEVKTINNDNKVFKGEIW
jgi:hypothetical protein